MYVHLELHSTWIPSSYNNRRVNDIRSTFLWFSLSVRMLFILRRLIAFPFNRCNAQRKSTRLSNPTDSTRKTENLYVSGSKFIAKCILTSFSWERVQQRERKALILIPRNYTENTSVYYYSYPPEFITLRCYSYTVSLIWKSKSVALGGEKRSSLLCSFWKKFPVASVRWQSRRYVNADWWGKT